MNNTFDNLTEKQYEQMLSELNERINPETKARIAARLETEMNGKKQTKERRFPWKAVTVAAAACLAVFLTLGFTVPGVADSLYRLAHPETTIEAYMSTLPEQREPIKEIDQAIEQTGSKNVSGCVELVGSYSGELNSDEYYNSTIHGTKDNEPFDPQAFDFLLSLEPALTEVYYDGSRAYVTAYFETPYAGDFQYGNGNRSAAHTHDLDMMTFEALCTVDGKPYRVFNAGSSTIPDYGEELDGFYMTSEIEIQEPLPDGIAEMTLYYYIYQMEPNKVYSGYNVARVKHVFTFDTTDGNRHEEKTYRLELSGNAPLTILRGGGKTENFTTVENTTVSLDGTVLSLDVAILPGGVEIGIDPVTLPEAFDEEMTWAFFNAPGGLAFDVFADGEPIEYTRLSTPDHTLSIELPIRAEDLANLRSVKLIPKLVYVTELIPYIGADGCTEGELTRLIVDAGPIENSPHDFRIVRKETTVFENCAIDILSRD